MTEEAQISVNQQIAELQGVTDIQPEFIAGLPTGGLIGKTKAGYRCRVADHEHSLDATDEALPEDADLAIEARYPSKHNGQYRARLTVRKPQLKVFVVRGEFRKEAAARSLLAYLQWKQSLEGV